MKGDSRVIERYLFFNLVVALQLSQLPKQKEGLLMLYEIVINVISQTIPDEDIG